MAKKNKIPNGTQKLGGGAMNLFIEECQLIQGKRKTELENHNFSTMNVVTDLSKSSMDAKMLSR